MLVVGWGRSIVVQRQDGTVVEQLGDGIIVELAGPEDHSINPGLLAQVDGDDIEISIPAEVAHSGIPVIDVDARGRLTLRNADL
jgi:hypothetical protein